jgi:hypothetical protein
MSDPFTQSSKSGKFLRVMKVIFFSKFSMNLFFLFLIIGLSIVGFKYISPTPSPTGQVILEKDCPDCPICEGTIIEGSECKQECEQDCDLCPVKTKLETKDIIKYKCPSGDLVEDLADCEDYFPQVSEEYSGTVGKVTFSIDNIEYEQDEEDSGFVTKVGYTIINNGDTPIVPKVEVKVYEEWNLKSKKSVANKVINPEIVVNPKEYTSRKDRVRIYFRGEEQTLRLLLVDSLPTIEQDIVAVVRDFNLDHANS